MPELGFKHENNTPLGKKNPEVFRNKGIAEPQRRILLQSSKADNSFSVVHAQDDSLALA